MRAPSSSSSRTSSGPTMGQLDFIESSARWSRSSPILVVSLARPELLERRPGWGARNATSLAPLEPLSDDAMRALLSGLVPGLPASRHAAILERAGGIPLYAVETIRMLVGRAPLCRRRRDLPRRRRRSTPSTSRRRSDRWSPRAWTPSRPPIVRSSRTRPCSVRRSRSRRWRVADRGVGRRWSRGCAASSRRDLLVLDTDPRSPERGQYGFVQSVIREVAYDTLAKRDRRARHLAAARYFEALGDEELSGALATHYQAAYRAAAEGPEADALAVQARVALRAAGERAASLGSPMQAIAFLTSALELPGPEPDRLELVQRAGAIAEEAGRHEQAVDLFERAITGWQALGDRTRAARAGAAAADAALLLGRDRVRAILDRAFVDFGAPDLGDRGWLELRAIEARSLLRAFQPRASIDVMEEMLPDVERLGDLRFALHCFETYAHALHELGRPIHSLLIHEGVLRHAMELGEMALVERVKINLAVLRMEDDPAVAHELNTAGFDDALRRGSLSIAAFFAGNAGEVEARLGDWETARGRLGRLLEFQPEAFDREMILNSIVIFDAMQGVVDPPSGRNWWDRCSSWVSGCGRRSRLATALCSRRWRSRSQTRIY